MICFERMETENMKLNLYVDTCIAVIPRNENKLIYKLKKFIHPGTTFIIHKGYVYGPVKNENDGYVFSNDITDLHFNLLDDSKTLEIERTHESECSSEVIVFQIFDFTPDEEEWNNE